MPSINLGARTWFLGGFLACSCMLLIAAYFQFVENLEPCPLCISQRILILLVALVMLAAVVHHPGATGMRVYAVVSLILCAIGSAISARHVWLQNLPPDQVPECGPGLSYVFKHFPLTKTLELLVNGTGECADVLWTFLGLSIPAWTLVGFILLAILSGAQLKNRSA